VAIKVFRLDVVPEVSAKLAGILKRLAAVAVEHPGVVPLIDAGLEGSTAYLAMEYVASETLDVGLRRLSPATIETVAPILRQVADAVEAARAVGIAHGALHPRDIFVQPAPADSPETGTQVRVSGFGVAEVLEDLKIAVPVRRPYIAPEREQGGHWDIRADVYSLGVIAHELLTGRRPTGSPEQDCELPADTPLEERIVIRRALSGALSADPEERYATPTAFVRALTNSGADEGAGETPPLPWPVEPEPVGESTFDDFAALETSAPAGDEPEPEGEQDPETDFAPDVDDEWAAQTEPEPDPEPVLDPIPAATQSRAPRMWPPQTDSDRLRDRAVDAAPIFSPASQPTATPPWEAPMRREMGIAALLVIALAAGTAFGYWLRGPAAVQGPESSVQGSGSKGDTTTSATGKKVPLPDEPIGTDVTVGEAAKGTPGARGTQSPSQTVAAPAPAATRGRLLVRSVPSGATVSINGRGSGTTPATIRDLPFGTHIVTLSRVGYRSRDQRVTISADAPARDVTIELSAAASPSSASRGGAATGSVLVETRPAGATVAIDGKVVGKAPLRLPGLSPGSHSVRVSLAGYKTVTSTVVVRAGQQTPVKLSLEIQ
jgi:serine/threonine protein kinase